MGFRLGDLIRNIESIEQIQRKLISHPIISLETERWDKLSAIAEKIEDACENRNLEMLVSSVRDMKNRLRRPAIRKELERLESVDKNDKNIPASSEKKNPTGQCKCSECGKVIDGSRESCIDGVLCTSCALKKKVISKKDQDKEKMPKAVSPGNALDLGPGAGMPGGEEGQGAPSEQRENASLRRRGYVL